MNKRLITKLSLALILLVAGTCYNNIANARGTGEPGFVALKVAELIQSNTTFQEVSLFSSAASLKNEQVSSTIKKYHLLKMDLSKLQVLLQNQPDYIKVSMPAGNLSSATQLLLYKVNISGNGFKLETSDGRTFQELNTIVHYRGIIENDMNSVVSLSFSKEETMGLFSSDEGNFVLGELENSKGNEYVFYNDKDLIPAFSYDCGTNTSNPAKQYQHQNNGNPVTQSVNCVDWYYEIDYDIFVGKGSLANVNSYIQGVFNQVSTLYNNDGVSITLQTLYVWTAVDPYTGPSTSNYLNQFGAYRTSFAGDLANLVGYSGSGGIAYVDGLCSANQYKMGYSGISSSYNTVPTYSWTVEVVTHEDGHLLGSKHTHDCVWNGNSTSIDGCGDAAGYNGSGTCATGPMPSSGTIMSYCHLVSGIGINFNNGFGAQPIAVILDNVNNASCLSACSACPLPPQPGAISGAISFCGITTQTYSVTPIAGATGYSWTTPSGWLGTSTTNSITVTTTATGGTISVVAINACGDSPAKTLTIAGNASPSQPGNLIGNTTVCQGSTQLYSVSAISGATSYLWTKPSGWSGTSTTNSISLVPGGTSGSISVAAINSCATGTARTITVTVNATPAQPGIISGTSTVCAATSYVYSVAAVSGATSYSWTIPSGWSGSSATNSITLISGSSGGTISVAANNSCGAGTASILTVSTALAPAQPGTITATGGNTKVCPGTTKTYSITAVSGATSYNWIPPAGSTITTGQGTISVTVNYNAGFIATDTIKVFAINGCSSSLVRFLKISRNTPVRPGAISGAINNVCSSNNVPYSVTNVGGITYAWSFNTGSASVTSGQGLNSIAASFTPNYLTGILSVTASNACGTSSARTLTVSAAPSQPGTMSGTTSPCSGQSGVPYSVAPVAGAVSYTWTVPTGSQINDGAVTSTTATLTTTSSSVSVNFGTTAGYVRVKANNSCGAGTNRSLLVAFSCRTANSVNTDSFTAIVYPNPASEEIKVQFDSFSEADQSIRITDMTGKNYLVQSGQSSAGTNEVVVDIRSLAPGIYFLEVLNGKDRSVSKLSVE